MLKVVNMWVMQLTNLIAGNTLETQVVDIIAVWKSMLKRASFIVPGQSSDLCSDKSFQLLGGNDQLAR